MGQNWAIPVFRHTLVGFDRGFTYSFNTNYWAVLLSFRDRTAL